MVLTTNATEYLSMMKVIAEGYGVLKAAQFNLDLEQVTQIYQEGTSQLKAIL